MKKILVICPTNRDKSGLQQKAIAQKYDIHFQTYDAHELERILYCGTQWLTHNFDPQVVIDQLCVYVQGNKIDGVFSSEDYPGSILASVVAQKMNLIGPSIDKMLTLHHKYHAREQQQIFTPDATPSFDYLYKNNKKETHLPKPFFVKPVKSFFSVGAQIIDNDAQDSSLQRSFLPDIFLQQFDWFINKYSSLKLSTGMVVVEDVLQGVQVTLEGFVAQGKVGTLGIADSIMRADCPMSFDKFIYPSQLPQDVCERMVGITKRLMRGCGFDNSFFNIEFMYDGEKDDIKIIEVNPRMASQFADFYEKVDGKSSYEYACDIALGNTPQVQCKKGPFGVAISFVLRCLVNKKILHVPTEQEIRQATEVFPDLRLYCFVTPGTTLADTLQDGYSFRYALVHLGGKDVVDAQHRFTQCMTLLPFKFENVTK